jgi:crossover junction endodeoxyribonuclease RuvC
LENQENKRNKILGIDCGTAITGWAVIEPGKNINQPKLNGVGIVETHKLSPEEERLLDLGNSIADLIEEFEPDVVAIEDIFFNKNAKTVIKVSQARGVVIYKAVQKGVKYFSYTPPQIKQRITGHGRAKKDQVIYMINEIFSLKGDLVQDDAADALAIAYCHYLSDLGNNI